jgi:Protein of unknown function (DUF2853)
MANHEDYIPNIQKYVAAHDEAAIKGIVRHCGIALTKRDSAHVAFSDPAEVARVREGFMKKKLALTDSDADLDKTLAEIGAKLKGEHNKSRVTVYYLIAEKYGRLADFHPKAK